MKMPEQLSTENSVPTSKAMSFYDNLKAELKRHLDSFQNESAAYLSFETYSGLNRKTLKRFLESNCTVYPQTVVRFYKWIFKTNCEKQVTTKLDQETKNFLVSNGYNMYSEKKDITDIVCKSGVHYEIYLMTEDQQTIRRSEIERLYGAKGTEALNDLLINEIVSSLDDNTVTTGTVRSSEDSNYYKSTASLIPKMLPWKKIETDYLDKNIGFTSGNVVVAKNDKNLLDKAYSEYLKKLCEIHERGLKTQSSERDNFIYSTLVFKPQLEREGEQ